ncbi:helix-turn-helix transcriptional regulator [Paraburkholderia tropica]|uniref:helix-turn-helix transcriptional regulator n=1 Tax=Paraburkholderia tropica TaxID=92647 RepID=UPI002AB0BCDC|nr:helix-turn-helix transcriptional regulator [Paraburkholderia tropica]
MTPATQAQLTASPDVGEDTDEDFVARLRRLITKCGSANALARRAGVSQSGFQRYLAGGQPTRKVLIALAQAAQVRLEWLITGKGEPESFTSSSVDIDKSIRSLTRLPLYKGWQSTDVIIEANATAMKPENVAGLGFCRFWLSQHGMDPSCLAGLYMSGNSMAPTIVNGDTILVNITQQDIVDGEIYALRSGDTVLVKRIQNELDGRLRLINDNPVFQAVEIQRTEVNIIGRVVWRGSLF